MRSTWTDSRLDDFREHVDSRLDDLNARFRELSQRLDGLSGRIDKLQHSMVQGFIAMFAAMLVGFLTLAGLIATRL